MLLDNIERHSGKYLSPKHICGQQADYFDRCVIYAYGDVLDYLEKT